MTFPHTATIQASTLANGKYTYATTGTTKCFLQPINDEAYPTLGVAYGKGFKCYLPISSTVAEKMRLVINGTTYGVKGIKSHDYGRIAHKQALLEAL